MKIRSANRIVKRGERGYAMLMVMFMATVVLVGAGAVFMDHVKEGQRYREQELAWRGNQYIRAVRLYYKKNGRFPKSLEDLTKYTSDQPRYIRKAYKDPMDTDDKGWRLIYVSPNGVLIGTTLHKTLYAGGIPGASQPGQPGAGTPGSTINPPGGTQPPSGGASPGPGAIAPPTQPPGQTDPNQPGQGPGGPGNGPMFGGQLVGVVSNKNKESIRTCNGGSNYMQWEFFWDPTNPTQGNSPCAPPNPYANPVPGIGTNPGQKPPTAPGTNPGTPPPQNPQQ
jgi:hypothetical protein